MSLTPTIYNDDPLRIFDPKRQPRQFGGVVSATALLFILLLLDVGWIYALMLVAGWSLGILLALNRIRVLSVFSLEPLGSSSRSSWSSGIVGSLLGIGLANISTGANVTLGVILFAVSIPTAILYAFCKLGCLKYGCCGWPNDSRFAQFLPMQKIEATLSFVIAAVSYATFLQAGVIAALYVFWIGHCLQRVSSQSIRAGGARVALSLDTVFVCVAIALNYGAYII